MIKALEYEVYINIVLASNYRDVLFSYIEGLDTYG